MPSHKGHVVDSTRRRCICCLEIKLISEFPRKPNGQINSPRCTTPCQAMYFKLVKRRYGDNTGVGARRVLRDAPKPTVHDIREALGLTHLTESDDAMAKLGIEPENTAATVADTAEKTKVTPEIVTIEEAPAPTPSVPAVKDDKSSLPAAKSTKNSKVALAADVSMAGMLKEWAKQVNERGPKVVQYLFDCSLNPKSPMHEMAIRLLTPKLVNERTLGAILDRDADVNQSETRDRKLPQVTIIVQPTVNPNADGQARVIDVTPRDAADYDG